MHRSASQLPQREEFPSLGLGHPPRHVRERDVALRGEVAPDLARQGLGGLVNARATAPRPTRLSPPRLAHASRCITTAVTVSESSSGEASGPFSPRPSGRLLLGAPLSLTGRYALMGRLAAAGLWRVVGDIRGLGEARVGADRLVPDLAVVDDESTREGVQIGRA